MKSLGFTRSGRVLAALLLALPLLLASAAPAHAYRYWSAAVSGSADDPARWTPNGIPIFNESIETGQPGAYTINFPATVANTSYLTCGAGSPTFGFLSPHTTGFLIVGSSPDQSPVVTSQNGVLNMQHLQIGYGGGTGTLTLTSTSPGGAYADFKSAATFDDFNPGDMVGLNGHGTLNVNGGAQFYSGSVAGPNWGLNIAPTAGYSGSVFVAGRNSFALLNSALRTVGNNDITVGVRGTGLLQITNRGFVDASDDMYIGYYPGSSGTVSVGPTTIGSSSLTVRGILGIGSTIFNTASGAALLSAQGAAFVTVLGRVDIGNPGGDQGSTLRMGQGATFRAFGGLRVRSTPGSALELRGGILNVRGGAFEWPASRTLFVSSQVGTPEIWIANGVANTGPSWPGITPQLSIGRGGSGLLRVSQPGTVFTCGLGPTLLGDSLTGAGQVVVDSSAIYTSTGYTTVGDRGHGSFLVLTGADANLGAVYVGRSNAAGSGTGGTLVVRGAGSTLNARNQFEVGSPSGDLYTGVVVVDSGGTLVLDTTTPGFDPLFTIRSKSGIVAVGQGSSFTSTGAVSLFGTVQLMGGTFGTTYNSMGTSSLIFGWGNVLGEVGNFGRIEPSSAADSFGVVNVVGPLTIGSTGRYVAHLGSSPTRSDLLTTTGIATLGGTLDLRTDASFSNASGGLFTILTCGARVGTFTAVTWNGAPLAGQAQVVYSADKVVVIVTATVGVDETSDSAPSELRFAIAGTANARAVQLDLPAAAEVDVRLYDVTGRIAADLFTGPLGAGQHRFELRGNGAGLASGAYFARATVRANGAVIQRTVKTTLLR